MAARAAFILASRLARRWPMGRRCRPNRISATVMVVVKRVFWSCASSQAMTAWLGLERVGSERTLVSRMIIRSLRPRRGFGLL